MAYRDPLGLTVGLEAEHVPCQVRQLDRRCRLALFPRFLEQGRICICIYIYVDRYTHIT